MNEIQCVILETFKCIANIFEQEDIPYYAIGGTCIGAVRHKGFIPWDDDLDIAVPIEHYDRMLATLNDNLPHYYTVRAYNTIGHYGNLFCKVIDERTTFIEKTEYSFPDAYKGIFVDIMPLSGVPEKGVKRKRFCTKIRQYRILNDIRRFPIWYQDAKWKKILWHIVRMRDKSISENHYALKWMELLRTQHVDNAKYVGYVWWRDIKELIWSIDVFADPVELPFEDTVIKCPAKWDVYLHEQFGDYMELPPVEQRKGIHEGTVDTKNPYHKYRNGLLQLQ